VKRIVFIVNPASGVFSKENVGGIIRSRLDRSLYFPEIIQTEGPGHATEICKTQIDRGTDVIVAIGGDGSVNEAARGIVGTDVTLGIIPAGSGNGLAHHLKIPTIKKYAIDVINRAKSVKIDTGMINDNLFVSIAGVGFDGLIAKRFEESKLRGFLSYLKLVAEEYPKYNPKKYRLEFEDEVIKTKALFITFANSDQFGFNTSIAPAAKIDDGLLDIIIATKPQIIELPYLASLLYWRKIESSKHILTRKTRELKIRTRKNRWVNLDGEAVKLGKELHIRILPKSLNIIVP